MSDNSQYWYSNFGSSSPSTELPPQAISSKKKNDKWKCANLDALERIGIRQLKDNIKFKDFYRMINGQFSYKEISEVIPQLREVGNLMEDLEIPSYIKHYDLIGIIINAMVGEYLQNGDKYNVTNIDEISTTEFERDKTELVLRYVKEQFQKELNKKVAQRGMNPNINEIPFQSEEEKNAYIQQLEQIKGELTPPEIQNFMSGKWRTYASIWGEHTLEADKERFKTEELDRQELIDFLLTGRCFRHFRLGYDYYKPESWSPINTFFSKDVETKYVQDGDYVGRIHYYTPNQVVNKYGHLLNKKQKENLLQSDYVYNYSTTSYDAMGSMKRNFGETHIVPHKNHYDYNFVLDIQDEFGVPMGNRTYLNKNNEEVTVPVYMPSPDGYNGSVDYLAKSLRDDLDIRNDLLRVTEAYWVSYKKIGYLNYTTESGRMTQEIVTDDLLAEFLKENGIKQVSSISLKELQDEPKNNTIVWDYVPRVWKGIKISHGNYNTSEAIYLEVDEMEMQIKGDSNIYEVKLPVSGIVDKSLALKIEPFQTGHNVAMNQIYNLIEKEIGLFFIFDINFLPSEFKDWGDTEESLIHLRNLTRDLGFFPVDSSKQNIRDGGGFNQFTSQNMSFSSQIADRMQLTEFYKNKAYEQIGFNPQRLGTPVKYETAEGVRQSQTASYAQTEIYFEKFSSYKKRMLEMHLNVAQYAQKNGQDITVFYTKSDTTKAFLKFSDDNFQLRQMGILPTNNSKKRKEREQFKAILMQNNTIGTDELALAELLTSDSMVEVINIARTARVKREQDIQSQRQHDLGVIEKQSQAQKDNLVFEWKLKEEYAKNRDAADLEQERIEAMGRAVDNDASEKGLDYINKQADLAIKRQSIDNRHELDLREANRKDSNDAFDKDFKMKQLQSQLSKTNSTLEKSRNDKYIAEINT